MCTLKASLKQKPLNDSEQIYLKQPDCVKAHTHTLWKFTRLIEKQPNVCPHVCLLRLEK